MIERTTLGQQVYENLVKRISDRELKVGARLKQVQLAKEFGISPIPVREALLRLEQEMWIENIPNQGATVRGIDMQEAMDLYDIRENLEGLAAKQAAERATERQLSAIEDYALMYSKLVEDGEWSLDKVPNLDSNFHRELLEASHNSRLVTMASLCNLQVGCVQLMQKIVTDVPIDIEERRHFANEHLELAHALRRRDASLAERLAREHIRAAKKIVMTSREEFAAGNTEAD